MKNVPDYVGNTRQQYALDAKYKKWIAQLEDTFSSVVASRQRLGNVLAQGVLDFGVDAVREAIVAMSPEGKIDGTLSNAMNAVTHLAQLPITYVAHCADVNSRLSIWDVSQVCSRVRATGQPAFDRSEQLKILDAVATGGLTRDDIRDMRANRIERLELAKPVDASEAILKQINAILKKMSCERLEHVLAQLKAS